MNTIWIIGGALGLMFALGVVEDLDLNTRIWSKAPLAAAG